MKRVGKIKTNLVAQGMDAGGEWEDLNSYFGDTPEQRYKHVCELIDTPGFGWKGAQLIERTIIEYPTGYPKLRKPNDGVKVANGGPAE